MTNLSQMSYSSDSLLIKVYFNHTYCVLVHVNSNHTWTENLRWGQVGVEGPKCLFPSYAPEQSPLNSSASSTTMLHLQHPVTSMRNALTEEDEEEEEG